MMMKRIIVIFLAFILALPAFSQFKFGLKAGVSTTNLKMENLKTLVSGNTSYTVEALKTAKYGFHAGAFVRVSLGGFYLQPELLFTSRTDVYQVTDLSNPLQSIEHKQQFNRLDLPVMLGVHLGPLRINAGPSARLLINSPKDLITNPDFKTMYNNLTFGYQAGIGVDFLKRITVDLRYEGSLTRYQTQVEAAAGTTVKLDDRPNAFLLSVGLVF
jgi:opacity protein-like surface antigen